VAKRGVEIHNRHTRTGYCRPRITNAFYTAVCGRTDIVKRTVRCCEIHGVRYTIYVRSVVDTIFFWGGGVNTIIHLLFY